MTRVLPEPAPASTRQGPPRWWTASIWALFSVAGAAGCVLTAMRLARMESGRRAQAVGQRRERLAAIGQFAEPAQLALHVLRHPRRHAGRHEAQVEALGQHLRRGTADRVQQLREAARFGLDVLDAVALGQL